MEKKSLRELLTTLPDWIETLPNVYVAVVLPSDSTETIVLTKDDECGNFNRVEFNGCCGVDFFSDFQGSKEGIIKKIEEITGSPVTYEGKRALNISICPPGSDAEKALLESNFTKFLDFDDNSFYFREGPLVHEAPNTLREAVEDEDYEDEDYDEDYEEEDVW